MANIFDPKPYWNKDYAQALTFAHKQELMHWYPEKVKMAEDVTDYQELPIEQKKIIDNILRFFTQGDIDIAGAYLDKYIPQFKDPSIRCMLSTFAAMEATHARAYAYLITNLNIPDSEFKAFLEYEEMVDKHEFYLAHKNEVEAPVERIALDIATFSAFGEGLQLYSSFAVLLAFCYNKHFKGLDSIVQWSAKDEALHVEGMLWLYHQIIRENPKIYTDKFRKKLYQYGMHMVELEFKFIDLVYSQGVVPNLEKEDLKEYVKYLADRRFLQLGLKPQYKVKNNPLPWMEFMLNGVVLTNFFEGTPTEYANIDEGTWGEGMF